MSTKDIAPPATTFPRITRTRSKTLDDFTNISTQHSQEDISGRINLNTPHFARVLGSNSIKRHPSAPHNRSLLSKPPLSPPLQGADTHSSHSHSHSHSHGHFQSPERQTTKNVIDLDLPTNSFYVSSEDLHGVQRPVDLVAVLDFDLTEDTLRELFNAMDVDEDGMITQEQFRACMRSRGVFGSDDKFTRLFRMTDTDKDGSVSFLQFMQAVQSVQLHHTYDRSAATPCTVPDSAANVVVWAYSQTRAELWRPEEFRRRHKPFFFNDMPQWAKVNWVHMHGMHQTMMRRFAVKFRLHPLALEDAQVNVVDALSLEQRPKAEHFNEHLFVIVPRVRLVHTKRANSAAERSATQWAQHSCSSCSNRLKRGIAWMFRPLSRLFLGRRRRRQTYRKLVEHDVPYTVLLGDDIEEEEEDGNGNYAEKREHMGEAHIKLAQLSIFCIADHTLFTVQNEAKDCCGPSDKPSTSTNRNRKRRSTGFSTNVDADISNAGTAEETRDWKQFERRLASRSSRLRHNNSYFLLYNILDAVVDEYEPVVEAFQARLDRYEQHLLTSNPDLHVSKSVARLKRQLELFHRLVRPVKEVVRHCIDDLQKESLATANTVTYMRDVQDHVEQVIDDCKAAMEGCRSVNEQIVQIRDQKMNEVMYFLTLITTVFIPAEFLTGVYGMNFDVMPELEWAYSYELFWVFFVSSTCVTLLYFRSRGWI